MYGADAKTCGYFTLHTTADVHHSNVWREQLSKVVENDPEAQDRALVAAENAARSLWRALDGVERERQQTESSVDEWWARRPRDSRRVPALQHRC